LKKIREKESSNLDKMKKYEKSHNLAGKSVSRKKSEREVCLLFWLEICSIIDAYLYQSYSEISTEN